MKKIQTLFLICFCCFSLSGCSTNKMKIDICDYAQIESIGYNEYGELKCTFDYESMFELASVSNGTKETVINIATEYDLFKLKNTYDGSLKNGDVVDVKWDTDKTVEEIIEDFLQVDFVKNKMQFTVKDLKKIETADLFDYLVVDNHNSISGNGTLSFKIAFSKNGHDIILPVVHNGIDGTIKNGDLLELKINENIDYEWFKKNLGFEVNKTTTMYNITELAEYSSSEDSLNFISNKNLSIFDSVADEWILSCLNDMQNSNLIKPRTKKHIGFVYLCNHDGNGMLCSIYEIDDYYAGSYYEFIGLKGKFKYDVDGWTLNDSDFPNTFVSYEKNKTRQTYGGITKENCEKMGFYSNDILFSGKRNLDELFDFINNEYGSNYENCFANTEVLKNIIKLQKGN